MCMTCKLLDNAFPAPKYLARALFEVQEGTVAHDKALYEKVIQKMEDQGEAYIEEFVEEGMRLSQL